jgi:CCR4-NOT transcription complex subunit 7/8
MVDKKRTKAASCDVYIREVWAANLEAEMEFIRDVATTHTFLAMDTEFPGIVVRPVGNFKDRGAYHYETLRANVDMLKLLQLGFTFCNEMGELPLVERVPSIWQFNFREFQMNADVYAQESMELLKHSGVDFDAQEQKGVDVRRFGELLITSGVVLSSNIQWITFHSAYDFGYLLKVCTGTHLPPTEHAFFDVLKEFFPTVYDIKYLMKFCNLHGGLNKLAKYLEVNRIGPLHQAGSDSLLTVNSFLKLVQTCFEGIENVRKHSGSLYGLSGLSGSEFLMLSFA